jgi:hypothetical protein
MRSVRRASPKLRQESGAAYCSEFRIGGVSVEVAGERADDVTLVSSLEPFRARTLASDINIRVEWADKLRPPRERALFDSGSVWRLYQDGAEFQFDFSALVLGEQPYKRLLVDDQFRQACLQMSSECFARGEYDPAPLSYPLDELLIMHRLTQEKAIELHGCGIVRPDGTGNLFVGHSGAGKSTTTRLWTSLEEVEVLSDDRIIVRRDDVRRDDVWRDDRADVGRCVRGDREEQIPHRAFGSVRNDKKMRMYGTPWHGEAMYASPNSAGLARIFVLEHGHGNVLTQLSPSQAVAELFARSFVPFHRHEYVESALEFLQEVVDAVPVYRYAFEPNQGAVERILEFRD